ncbi:MAG: hypothetical protein SGILL_002215 [Bacillariaceae sp.]
MKLTTQLTVLVVTPAVVSSFSAKTSRPTFHTATSRISHLYSTEQPRDGTTSENDNDGLVLDELDQEMGKMASKFAFSESDFLAAAKKRAAERVESVNSSAADSDWKNLAAEKKSEMGEIDDWENSQKEAGNEDSQILMFTEPSEDGEGGGDDGEPKLLLF